MRITLAMMMAILVAGCSDDNDCRPCNCSAPPQTVTTLHAVALSDSSVRITWTAPDDDCNGAEAYDIRYSTSTSGVDEWWDEESFSVPDPPAPKAPGEPETFAVSPLAAETNYGFALRTRDDLGKWSGISNEARATTAPPPGAVYRITPYGNGDFATIQDAIDAADDGDIIELTDGMFAGDGNHDIDYGGKAVTVRSERGDPSTCVISCGSTQSDPHRAFLFQSGEGEDSVLEGVEIREAKVFGDAWPNSFGGAIFCANGSAPTIRGCIIRSCDATYGAGLHCKESDPVITECQFIDNEATIGGGLHLLDASPTVDLCIFVINKALQGGAIQCHGPAAAPQISRCTLVFNQADNGAGLNCGFAATPLLFNVIIASSFIGPAISCTGNCAPTLICCNLYANSGGDWTGCVADQAETDGNLSADPLFCGGENYFSLSADSPCAAENAGECGQIGAWGVGCE